MLRWFLFLSGATLITLGGGLLGIILMSPATPQKKDDDDE